MATCKCKKLLDFLIPKEERKETFNNTGNFRVYWEDGDRINFRQVQNTSKQELLDILVNVGFLCLESSRVKGYYFTLDHILKIEPVSDQDLDNWTWTPDIIHNPYDHLTSNQ